MRGSQSESERDPESYMNREDHGSAKPVWVAGPGLPGPGRGSVFGTLAKPVPLHGYPRVFSTDYVQVGP